MNVKIKKHHLVLKGDCSKIETGIEGDGITIISSPKESPLVALEINGISSQENYVGYNILDISGEVTSQRAEYEKTQTGIKLTNSTGTTYNFVKFGSASILEGQTYTVSASVELSRDFGADRHAQIIAIEEDESGAKLKERYLPRIYASGENFKTFTAIAGTKRVTLQILSSNDLVANVGSYAIFSNLAISLGDTVLTYEPFVGGKKSPSIDFPQDVQSFADEFLKIDYKADGETLKEICIGTKNVFGDGTIDLRLSAVGNTFDTLKLDGKRKKVEYIKRTAKIENYSGENVGDTYISNTGELSFGASVLYPLSEEIVYDLTNTDFGKEILLEAVPSGSKTVELDGGLFAKQVKLKYRKTI